MTPFVETALYLYLLMSPPKEIPPPSPVGWVVMKAAAAHWDMAPLGCHWGEWKTEWGWMAKNSPYRNVWPPLGDMQRLPPKEFLEALDEANSEKMRELVSRKISLLPYQVDKWRESLEEFMYRKSVLQDMIGAYNERWDANKRQRLAQVRASIGKEAYERGDWFKGW